jgi:hypothetical protein
MPRPADDGWVSTGGRERDWGWVISWLSKPEAQGSTATRHLHADGRPFLTDRKTVGCRRADRPQRLGVRLGDLLSERGDDHAAEAAYRRAGDSGIPRRHPRPKPSSVSCYRNEAALTRKPDYHHGPW